MTEWRDQYDGRDVVVCWHLGRKLLCIQAPLKSVFSSKAAIMMENVPRHCTNTQADRIYVDSGQSEVVCSFADLLASSSCCG